MDNKTVNVAARVYILDTKTGKKESLGDTNYNLTREQYERLLTSYKTKNTKFMNDDESVADICEQFIEQFGYDDYGYDDLQNDQKIIVSYPIEISNGLSFDALSQIPSDEQSSYSYTSDWHGDDLSIFNCSQDKKIELCDGNVAYYHEKQDIYLCLIAWLGREIKVRLYSDESNDAQEKLIRKAFENFYTNKSDFLKMCQNDVVNTLLPYIAANKSVSDLDITEDDFYADYSLDDIYIYIGEFGDEMQLSFISEDGKNMIAVHRDLENGCILDLFDGINVFYSDDLGL